MPVCVEAEERVVKWALVFIKTKTGGNSELFLESCHGRRFNSATGKVYISCIHVVLHQDVGFPALSRLLYDSYVGAQMREFLMKKVCVCVCFIGHK